MIHGRSALRSSSVTQVRSITSNFMNVGYGMQCAWVTEDALRLNVTDDVHVCWKIITCPVVCDRSMLIAVKRYRRRACLLENHNMSSGVRT